MVSYLGTLGRFIGSTVLLTSFLLAGDQTPYRPHIPKTWVVAELQQMDVPVSQPAYSPKAVSPAYHTVFRRADLQNLSSLRAPPRARGYREKLKLPCGERFRHLRAKPDKIIVDVHAARPSSWKTPRMAVRIVS
jgi:hypothetical protein